MTITELDPTLKPIDNVSDASSVPKGIRMARAAFLRDFPKLMADRKTRGKLVLYHFDQLIAVAKTERVLIREVNAKEIPDGEWIVFEVSIGDEWHERALAEGTLDISR